MYVLVGVAGTGKTSVAQLLAKKYNWAYIPVEARACWREPPGLSRQICFLRMFTLQLGFYKKRKAIADNGIASVYAYTKAMPKLPVRREIEMYLRKLSEMEAKHAKVVVLTASPDELQRRIEVRLSEEPSREKSTVEKMIGIHIKAQEYLTEFAKYIGLPIIDTTKKTIEEVAKEVVRRV